MRVQELADRALRYASDSGAKYCDVRAELQKRESAVIESGQVEHVRKDIDEGIGIRLIKDKAWGFCSITSPRTFGQVRDAIDGALKSASHYSESKKNPVSMHPNPSARTKKEFPVLKRPELERLLEIGFECDEIISKTPRIIKSVVSPRYAENSKYFASSEGSQIMQRFTDVVVDMNAIAHESGLTQSINITEGGRGGVEQITHKEKIQNSAKEIAQKASQLIDAKPVKGEEASVIMNPDFVSLLAHEILGHPSEADRVMGKEMAWAGGAWWKRKIGKKIGSEELNVFDDPTIKESLGWYYFDDEGVEAKKTALVEGGTLKGHMQSRETAVAFGVCPTGNMRATNYRFMPLIRMACTCIGGGDWDAEEMVRETKNGYLISNMKVPSIDHEAPQLEHLLPVRTKD